MFRLVLFLMAVDRANRAVEAGEPLDVNAEARALLLANPFTGATIEEMAAELRLQLATAEVEHARKVQGG